jgi:hypothetical protein
MQTKKLTIGLTITLFALIILLLFLLQKDADAQVQQKAIKLQDQLRQPQIKQIILFSGYDQTGKMIINNDNTFKKGTKINALIQVIDVSSPETQDGKYVFGLQEYAQTTDNNGNIATPYNGLVANIDNYLPAEGSPVTLNNQFETTREPSGTYHINITIIDKLSKKQAQSQITFKLT